MANAHRALLALSDNLGVAINREYDREDERIRAMREENFMRIRHALDEQSRAADRKAHRELFDLERQDRKTENEADRSARREEAQADRDFRQKEGQADRDLRRSEGAADRAAMTARYDREDAANMDASYLRQLTAIDERLQALSDMKLKPGLEGMAADPGATAEVDREIASLQKQKQSLARERDVMLARRGDKRYQPISAEEAEALLAADAPAPATEEPAAAPVAAQGPTSVKTPRERPAPKPPTMPPMDPAMAERLKKQESRRLFEPTGEKGAANKAIAGAVRAVADKVGGANEASLVSEALRAAKRKKVSPELRERVRAIGRDRLIERHGFTAQELAAFGL